MTRTTVYVLAGSATALSLVALWALWPSSLLVFPTTSRFGADVLAQAKKDLSVTGSGSADRVAQMLATFGITTEANWCAAATGSWIRQAATADGVATPLPGSAGAQATMRQFQAGGTKAGWIAAGDLRKVPGMISLGMVPVWTRGPAGSGQGHIGVVSQTDGRGGFSSIEGNAGSGSGGSVLEESHAVSSNALLGMGYFKDAGIFAGGANA